MSVSVKIFHISMNVPVNEVTGALLLFVNDHHDERQCVDVLLKTSKSYNIYVLYVYKKILQIKQYTPEYNVLKV